MELYQVTTGNLNKAVKRNIKRFPPNFMFQLTKEEFEELRNNLIFQNGISSWGGTRKLPRSCMLTSAPHRLHSGRGKIENEATHLPVVA